MVTPCLGIGHQGVHALIHPCLRSALAAPLIKRSRGGGSPRNPEESSACMPLQKFAIPSVSLKMFGELQRHCSKLFFFAFHATTVILDSNGVKVHG
jgi:hypothetical protein